MKKFCDMKLNKDVMSFIELNGFNEPTKIQEAAIPEILKKKSVIAISKTGTGKTHAFLISIFNMIDPSVQKVQAVITTPTRELAMQIYNRAKLMNEVNPDIDIKLITGGIEKSKMSEGLKKQPHIVIGTPGRIKDLFLQESVLRVDTANIYVVDEADMTLEYGFLDDVDAICSKMGEDLQMLAFSATIPQALKPFLKKYMASPVTIQIKEDEHFNPRVNHVLVPCRHKSYAQKVVDITKGFMPYVCLIFANTRQEASEVANALRQEGNKVVEIHGGLSARERKQAMKQLVNLEESYVVATDIAARGIDIEGITHVISCGLPSELDFYIHRSGRTGRAGKDGTCYLLYQEQDDQAIKVLTKQGLSFKHEDFKNGQWRTLKPYGQKYIAKNDEHAHEISKRLGGKKKKVKPGYKKKIQREIEQIQRKECRDFIRHKIKEQRKEHFKQRQIEKQQMGQK